MLICFNFGVILVRGNGSTSDNGTAAVRSDLCGGEPTTVIQGELARLRARLHLQIDVHVEHQPKQIGNIKSCHNRHTTAVKININMKKNKKDDNDGGGEG